MPIRTARPYYRAAAKIKLNLPVYAQTHTERMGWITEQAGILNSERLVMGALGKAGFLPDEISEKFIFVKNLTIC